MRRAARRASTSSLTTVDKRDGQGGGGFAPFAELERFVSKTETICRPFAGYKPDPCIATSPATTGGIKAMQHSVFNRADTANDNVGEPFDAQERQVLWLADSDPASSVPSVRAPLGRLRSFLRGPEPTYTLANPRLETLRQSAIILRTGRSLTGEELDAFDAAGFSREQLDLLRVLYMTGDARRAVVRAA
jgi:hypothetical protein